MQHLSDIPLAERVRPREVHQIFGQDHLLGKDGPISLMLQKRQMCSAIFWGHPGTGKTTIARLIAQKIQCSFFELSAAMIGVKEIRTVIEACQEKKGILFLDEIHRFSKSQQDILLGAVERGVITLIGATTENPSFELNKALLSRLQVFIINPLSEEDMLHILNEAINQDVCLNKHKIHIESTSTLFAYASGDARKMLNILEMLSLGTKEDVIINDENVNHFVQQKIATYDKQGEEHYNIISAFIKSIRGSDPHASLYWLARMLDAGEDILFIARRMIILASEDIGLANPNALVLANVTFESVHKVGMPEARIILSSCVIYLACSEKSNAAYLAIDDALSLVKEHPHYGVPLHLRNAPTSLMKKLNYGKSYQYAHDYKEHFAEQEFMPEVLSGKSIYHPQDNNREHQFEEFLQRRWKKKYQ